MGINCPGIRQVVDWGPSEDVEAYLQETGRAGRDGKMSCALLFVNKGDLSVKGRHHNTSSDMIGYCQSQTCRRAFLLSKFDPDDQSKPAGCSCCDNCIPECSCDKCKCSTFLINQCDVKPFNISGESSNK